MGFCWDVGLKLYASVDGTDKETISREAYLYFVCWICCVLEVEDEVVGRCQEIWSLWALVVLARSACFSSTLLKSISNNSSFELAEGARNAP